MASHPYPARAFSIGAVLARAFAAIGSAPLAFFGVGVLLVGAPALVSRLTLGGLFTPSPQQFGDFARHLPLYVAGAAAWWLLYIFAQTLLYLLTAAASEGRRPGVGALIGAALRILPLAFAQSLLLTLAITLASVLLIVPGVLLWLVWAVAAPALVIERAGLFASFGRSRRLTAGARPALFAILLLVFAIYYVAAGAIGIISVTANGIGAAAVRSGPMYLVTSTLSAVLGAMFVTVWSTIKATLLLALREAKEGPTGDRLAGIFA